MISIRTEDFRIISKKSLRVINIEFEAKNAPVPAYYECLTEIDGCCKAPEDFDSPGNVCYLKEKFRQLEVSKLERYPFIKLEGQRLELLLENVTFYGFNGISLESLIAVRGEGGGGNLENFTAKINSALFEQIFFTNGIFEIQQEFFLIEKSSEVKIELNNLLISNYNKFLLKSFTSGTRNKLFIFNFKNILGAFILKDVLIKDSLYLDYFLNCQNSGTFFLENVELSGSVVFSFSNCTSNLKNVIFGSQSLNTLVAKSNISGIAVEELFYQGYEMVNSFNISKLTCVLCQFLFVPEEKINIDNLFRLANNNELTFIGTLVLTSMMTTNFIALRGNENKVFKLNSI